MADNEVAFPAIIKSVSVKRTASEDREARLVLDFRPDEDVMTGLVKLSQLETEVMVAIVPVKENNLNNRQHNGRSKRKYIQPEGTPEGDSQ
jgi:hypothetical protein